MGSESAPRDGSQPTAQDAPGSPAQVQMPADFTSVIDAFPLPMYALGDQNTVVAWSDGREPLRGLSRPEMLGHGELTDEDGTASGKQITDTTAGSPVR